MHRVPRQVVPVAVDPRPLDGAAGSVVHRRHPEEGEVGHFPLEEGAGQDSEEATRRLDDLAP